MRHTGGRSSTLTFSDAPRLLVALAIAWLPLLIDRDAVSRVAALHDLGAGPTPYFVDGHAALLYLWSPLVAGSACFLLISPGLLLALAKLARKPRPPRK